MRRIFLSGAAVLLSIVLLTGGIFVRSYRLKPTPSESLAGVPAAQEAAGYKTDATPSAYGPVTVFGLTPEESGTAKLVSENITFSKDTTQTGEMYGLYPAEMRYTVELTDTASFVLPHAYIKSSEKYMQTEIYVDGSLADYKIRKHPAATAQKPTISEGSKRQSVSIYPDHWDEDSQPADSYELLMQAWKKTPAETYPQVHYEFTLSGWVNMYTFDIEGAGTHEILIKLVAIGDDILCGDYMLEWAASPSNMWNGTGDRNLSVIVDQKRHQYAIDNALFKFEQPKGGITKSPSLQCNLLKSPLPDAVI